MVGFLDVSSGPAPLIIPGAGPIRFFKHPVKMLHVVVSHPVADFIHPKVRGLHQPLCFFKAHTGQVLSLIHISCMAGFSLLSAKTIPLPQKA